MYADMLTAASALFAVGAVLAFDRWKRERASRLLAGSAGEGRTSRAIALAGGRDRADRVFVESKPGRAASIDHVVKGSKRLVVVETKNWNGVICGKRRERDWIQIRPDGTRVPQRNPVMQAKRQAKILSEAVGVPVAHLVVMAGRARHVDDAFTEEVVCLDTLSDVLPALMDGDHLSGEAGAQDVEAAWKIVMAITLAPDTEERANTYGNISEDRHGHHEWVGWMAVSVAACAAALAVGGN